MTTVYLYGGVLKRDIIQRAYGFLGQSWTEFELTPEEYAVGLRAMNDQMSIINVPNYNLPAYGDGNPEDESGIVQSEVLGASCYVAKLLGPTIGKAMQSNDVAERACTSFLAKYQPLPTTQLRSTTPRGSGNPRTRWLGWEYFPLLVDTDDA